MGVVAQVDVREDEEQDVKLRACIDLLLAAGYFRARIKGLSPFDKVSNCTVAPLLDFNWLCRYNYESDCWWNDLVYTNM